MLLNDMNTSSIDWTLQQIRFFKNMLKSNV